MRITHDLLPKQKRRKSSLKVEVELFPLATELYEELDRIGMIEHLKNVKQLGSIAVRKQFEKSRFDYVLLQLYLHQMLKAEISKCLKFSYGSTVNGKKYAADSKGKKNMSIYDAVQLLSIVYNIGHFSNTFVASKAFAMLAESNQSFRDEILSSISNKEHRSAISALMDSHNYQRMHLINSYLILESCDGEKAAVRLAKELIYSYISEDMQNEEEKLAYVFKIYRTVRTLSFIAYDLQTSEVPFAIDLGDKDGLCRYFQEVLAEYSDGKQVSSLLDTMADFLDASLYNEPASVICSTQISKKMIALMLEKEEWDGYLEKCFRNPLSAFNVGYPKRKDFDTDNILKLTFCLEERNSADELFQVLDHINNTRVGYYLRHDGKMTILLAIRKTCGNKGSTAFKVLKRIVTCLRSLKVQPYDERYILSVKFFLFYVFGERRLAIKPITDPVKCVICSKGYKRRIVELEGLLKMGSEDQKHEVKAMINYLQNDLINDISITISGSTIVYDDNWETVAEFDGIILYPNRRKEQIVLVEAKNTKRKAAKGKKCLAERLKKLNIDFEEKDINMFDHDAYYRMSM